MLLFAIAGFTLLALFYLKRIRAYRYWQKHGFQTLERKPNWFFGHFGECLLGQKSFVELFKEAHFEFKRRGIKIGGLYMVKLPILLVTDSEIMKLILQTDFEAFADRGIALDPVNNPLSMHLFALDGEPWKKIRRKLSPTYTSGKTKLMFPIVEQHADVLIKVTKELCKSEEDIEYHPYLDKLGIDVIFHVAFGLNCNTLENENKTFFKMAHRITRPKIWKILKLFLINFANPADIVTLLTSDKEMADNFIMLVKNTIQHRRENNIQAMDFLQLLIEMLEKEEKEEGSGLNFMEVAAQAFAFFMAGFETTSRTIHFALYALARDQKQQSLLRECLRKEIAAANGIYEYDWIMNNEKLDSVIKETLRLYAPVITLNRKATRDYEVPGTGLTIPNGTCVVFSSFGFHHDPELFEDPLEFKPERFDKENVSKILPFTNIPFGDGPRFCIGKRFGYLQPKLALAKILMNFEISPGSSTEYPLKISRVTKSMLLTTEKPIYFKIKSLK